MILANATVDVLQETAIGLGLYRVEVCGVDPYDWVRIYEIRAKNDEAAARVGLEQFVEEITLMIESEGKH